MGARALRVARTGVFALVTILDICVLGLAARIISKTASSTDDGFFSVIFTIITSVLTLSLPLIVTLEIYMRSPVTSMILTELSWLSFLFLMWCITVGLTLGSTVCEIVGPVDPTWLDEICADDAAISVICFIVLLALLGYSVALLAMSLISQSHGVPVWKFSVMSAKFKHVHLVPPQSSKDEPASGGRSPRDDLTLDQLSSPRSETV